MTSGLRGVFNSLNQDLFEHNGGSKKHYEANLICGVLHEDELFLGRVGSSIALYRHEGDSHQFPTEFSNDESLFGPPLGVQPVPELKMTRYAVGSGSRLILADSRLADFSIDKMNGALMMAEIGDVLLGFKDLEPRQLSLLAVEFVPPEAPSPAFVKDTRPSTRHNPQPAVPVIAPTPEPAASTTENEPAKRRRGDSILIAQMKRLGGGLALLVAGFLGGINRILDRVIPPPAEGGRGWLRTTTATGIAVLIPIAIVGLVMAVVLGRAGESEFEFCVEGSNKLSNIARSINSGDRAGVLAAWNGVIAKVDQCNDMRPEGDPSLAALVQEAQRVIDALYQVSRRPTFVVDSFTGASLNRMVLQGLDMYVLDGQNQLVYRVTLDTDGRSVVPNSRVVVPGMRLGALVGEFRVGRMVDILWSEEEALIMALDETGLLIECSPRFLQDCAAQRLLASERWGNPIKMTFWQGRLYILDPGANQIWRYDNSGGIFSSPIEYFAGDARPDISAAVGFGIDGAGVVYILNASGEISKWTGGKQTSFGYASFPEGQILNSADALFLSADPLSQGLYIVSRTNRTIYETSLAGTWVASYRAQNEDDFAGLTSVFAEATQQIVYTLSGNSIFAFDRTQTATP